MIFTQQMASYRYLSKIGCTQATLKEERKKEEKEEISY